MVLLLFLQKQIYMGVKWLSVQETMLDVNRLFSQNIYILIEEY